ncbi:ribosomal RNA small subunit methyltransferase A [Candidatus Micrarchaeota archaeon]|nr:ribosomal RNA small subunit methyltransferase A [Candidatus Micrarchaeota archaeon]
MLREELLSIFERYALKPKKKLSQSFLVDERVIKKEVEYAEAEGKEVLEIGAGVGFLTRALAEKAKRVVAIEKDARLVKILKSSLPPNVEIVEADFLKYNAGKTQVIVSNLPYSISSPLTFKIAEMEFEHAVLCYQEEFARRMLAKPGTEEYSRLSVMSQLSFELKFLQRVPRNCFLPVPKVHSAIIMLKPKKEMPDEISKELINLLFQHRNKTLRSSLLSSSRNLGISKKELIQLAERIPLKKRRVVSLTQKEILEVVGNEELRDYIRKKFSTPHQSAPSP